MKLMHKYNHRHRNRGARGAGASLVYLRGANPHLNKLKVQEVQVEAAKRQEAFILIMYS